MVRMAERGFFEDGFFGVSGVVADGDALVLDAADEVVGVDLAGELLEVGSAVVLAGEVAVLQGDEKAGGFGDGFDGAGEDHGFGGGPGAGGGFAAVACASYAR